MELKNKNILVTGGKGIFFLFLIIISSTIIFSSTNAYGETDYEKKKETKARRIFT